jgi:hypothetical protein
VTPEKLLELATVQGIDLQFFAGQMPPKEARPVRQRKLLGLNPRLLESARGHASTQTVISEWTKEDFAIACAGMAEVHWTLMCYTVFPREEDRILLKSRLMLEAVDRARRERWPSRIRRGDCARCGKASRSHYLEDLCTLALLEWHERDELKTQEDLAQWFGVSREYWSRCLQRKLKPMQSRLEYWWGCGIGHIWLRLRSITQANFESCEKAIS